MDIRSSNINFSSLLFIYTYSLYFVYNYIVYTFIYIYIKIINILDTYCHSVSVLYIWLPLRKSPSHHSLQKRPLFPKNTYNPLSVKVFLSSRQSVFFFFSNNQVFDLSTSTHSVPLLPSLTSVPTLVPDLGYSGTPGLLSKS